MTSTIICGGSADERLEQARRLAGKISQGVDLVILDQPSKIEEVRQIIQTLTRKPYQSKGVSVILSEAGNLTPEAQNALLKTLEEPPGDAALFLLLANPEKLLPTVRSRCQIIDLGPRADSVTISDLKSAWKLYQEGDLTNLLERSGEDSPSAWAELFRQILLYSLGGEKLLAKTVLGPKIAGFIPERDLDRLAYGLDQSEVRRFLAATHQAALDLGLNVNHRLTMENLLLQLPKPKNGVMNPADNYPALAA